jgi:hypothetical protein
MPPPEQMIAEYPLMAQRIAALEAQLAWFKKQAFGGGKSEKLDPAQRQLPLGGVEQARSAVVEHTEKIAYERAKRREPRPTPAEAFTHVPVTETVEIVPEAVRNDPELYEKIGEERTFELEIIGPRLVKREIVRPKFRRKVRSGAGRARRLRLCGTHRLDCDRQVRRSSAALPAGPDVGALGRNDQPPHHVRLGGSGGPVAPTHLPAHAPHVDCRQQSAGGRNPGSM